jgi:DNA invertase Pin-like site-specific DNA recombinase
MSEFSRDALDAAQRHRVSVLHAEVARPTTRSGRFMINILGALSSMEREIIVERTRAGPQAAAKRGRRGGRPPALDEAKVGAAKAMLASGEMSAVEVAQQLGCAPAPRVVDQGSSRSGKWRPDRSNQHGHGPHM